MTSLLTRARKLVTSAAGIYLLATVLSRAGGIVLIPLYTRRLSVAQFGDYALAQTLIQLLLNVLSLGTGAAVSRFYFDGTDLPLAIRKTGAAARFSILLTVAIALPCQLAICLCAPHATNRLAGAWELSCILWASVGSYLASVPSNYLRSAQRPILASVLQLFQFLSTVGTGILFVAVMQRELRGAIEALALAAALNGVLAVVFVLYALPGRITGKMAREAVAFSLPFVPHLIANHVGAASDRWVMKGVSQDANLGAYSLASQLTSPGQMMLQAWNEADAPRMGELYRTGGKAAIRANLPRTLVTYVAAALLPGIAAVLAFPLLKLFVGGRFSHSLWPVPVMAALLVVESLYFPAANVLFYLRRTKIIPAITVSAALTSAGLNLLFIPWLGISGALITRLVSAVIRACGMLMAATRALASNDESQVAAGTGTT